MAIQQHPRLDVQNIVLVREKGILIIGPIVTTSGWLPTV